MDPPAHAASSAESDYLTPYREAQREHGADFKATLWAHRKSQRIRFRALSRAIDFRGRRLLDAGSGLGDFAQYLLDQGVEYDRYVGVDGIEAVVDAANRRGLPQAEFHAGDLVRDATLFQIGRPDIIAISGTLNTMTEPTALTLLDHAWAAAGQTLLFNFLPTTAGPDAPIQKPPARRLDTHQLLRWAFAKTWSVRYRQDYFPHGHDAMIRMDKPPTP